MNPADLILHPQELLKIVKEAILSTFINLMAF